MLTIHRERTLQRQLRWQDHCPQPIQLEHRQQQSVVPPPIPAPLLSNAHPLAVLYIDQPIGTGFSYGTDTVDSTFTAAPPIWQAIQLLFESPEFAGYSSREFILATESYGGHYGPEFAEYFEIQNNAIAAGTLAGVQIKLSGLMINKCASSSSLSATGG